MKIDRWVFVLGLTLTLAAPAMATDFLAYEGKPVVQQGDGGTRKVVDGIDFWMSGSPPHRFQILGTVQDSRHETGIYGMIRMSSLDHDVAKAVHAAGGDGVILEGEGEKVVGIAHSATTNLSGSYGDGRFNSNGSSFGIAREMKSHQVTYTVVRYLPDQVPEAVGAPAQTPPAPAAAPR